jgi:hypothetical protein
MDWLYQDNPLFRLEMRRVRWANSTGAVRRAGIRIGFWIVNLLILLWLLQLFIGRDRYFEASSASLQLLLLAGLLLDAALDCVGMAFAVNSIGGEIAAGRWDLLHLTALEPDDIVEAKHTAAHIRASRAAAVVTSVRLAGVILLVLFYALVARRFGFYTSSPQYILLLMLSISIAAVVYIFEPTWRVRAVTALGVAVSTRVQNGTSVVLAGLGAVLAVWVSQALIGAALITFLSVSRYDRFYYRPMTQAAWALFICLALTAALGLYYTLLTRFSLRYAARRIRE